MWLLLRAHKTIGHVAQVKYRSAARKAAKSRINEYQRDQKVRVEAYSFLAGAAQVTKDEPAIISTKTFHR